MDLLVAGAVTQACVDDCLHGFLRAADGRDLAGVIR